MPSGASSLRVAFATAAFEVEKAFSCACTIFREEPGLPKVMPANWSANLLYNIESGQRYTPLTYVERGVAREGSAVTVVGAAGTVNMNTHAKDANDLLRVIADTMIHPTSNDYWIGGEPWIVLSPEHAHVLHREGLTKADVKRELWERSKMAAGRMAAKDLSRTRVARTAELGPVTEETLLPITVAPESIGIIVAGGPGTHSVYVPSFGDTRAVTREIEG